TRIDRVRALWSAGRIADSRKQAPALVEAADATQWIPVRAEAKYLAAKVSKSFTLPAAEAELIEANKLATDAHDDPLAAEAQVDLVDQLALAQRRAGRALRVAQLAEAAVVRAGNDPRLRTRLLRFRGDAYYTAGKLAEASEAFTRARAVATEAFG